MTMIRFLGRILVFLIAVPVLVFLFVNRDTFAVSLPPLEFRWWFGPEDLWTAPAIPLYLFCVATFVLGVVLMGLASLEVYGEVAGAARKVAKQRKAYEPQRREIERARESLAREREEFEPKGRELKFKASELDHRAAEIRREREGLAEQRSAVAQERAELAKDRSDLARDGLEVDRTRQEVERMRQELARERAAGERALRDREREVEARERGAPPPLVSEPVPDVTRQPAASRALAVSVEEPAPPDDEFAELARLAQASPPLEQISGLDERDSEPFPSDDRSDPSGKTRR